MARFLVQTMQGCDMKDGYTFWVHGEWMIFQRALIDEAIDEFDQMHWLVLIREVGFGVPPGLVPTGMARYT